MWIDEYYVIVNDAWDELAHITGERRLLTYNRDMEQIVLDSASYKKLKTKYNKEKRMLNLTDNSITFTPAPIATSPQFSPQYFRGSDLVFETAGSVMTDWSVCPQKKENNMGYNEMMIDDGTRAQREHLRSRLHDAYWTKRDELGKKFNRDGDAYPKTFDEITKRLADGAFKLNKNLFNKDGKFIGYGPAITEAIEWRTKEFDKEGFEAGEKLLDAAKQIAKDEIMILPPDKGLESLRTFEAYTV